jgi:hypothetical protein
MWFFILAAAILFSWKNHTVIFRLMYHVTVTIGTEKFDIYLVNGSAVAAIFT